MSRSIILSVTLHVELDRENESILQCLFVGEDVNPGTATSNMYLVSFENGWWTRISAVSNLTCIRYLREYQLLFCAL